MRRTERRDNHEKYKELCALAQAGSLDISERFELELQHVRHVQHDRLPWRDQPTHLVHHNGRADDCAVQHQFAGHFQHFQTNLARQQQQLDEGRSPLGCLRMRSRTS